jgi:flagellar assembly protein FliH
MSATVIPKESAAAFERWELDLFDRPAPPPRLGPSDAQGVKLPTADEIERIHTDAHRAGYAAGYEEGTARVRVEAMRLHTLAENLEQALASFDQELAQDVLTLALEIARQLMRQALSVQPELVAAVVKEALHQLYQPHATVHLHPEDAALVRQHVGELLAHAGHRIVEENTLSRGGCRVEAGGSQIDATVETRWRRVQEAFSRSGAWLDPPPAKP